MCKAAGAKAVRKSLMKLVFVNEQLFFTLLGSARVKVGRKQVDEIDPIL